MITGALAALGLAACMPATEEKAGSMADMNAPSRLSGPIVGEGVVTAVDASTGAVTLDHEPIEAIGWSAMTMRFTAADAALLSGVAVGDRVRFELRSGDDPRTIVALRKP